MGGITDMIRRTTTKMLFARSLEDLAAFRAINKIRISDITANCGYTQPMFYYYFRDKDDLINNIFREHFNTAAEKAGGPQDIRWLFTVLDQVIEEKHDFYLNALKHTHGVNSLYNYSAQYMFEYTLNYICTQSENERMPQNLEMMLQFYILGVRTVTAENIVNGKDNNPTDMIRQFLEALPSDLKPYLLR